MRAELEGEEVVADKAIDMFSLGVMIIEFFSLDDGKFHFWDSIKDRDDFCDEDVEYDLEYLNLEANYHTYLERLISKQADTRPSAKTILKSNLPQKVCTVCNRPFSWRKKWEKCWDDVKYCSEKCRRSK